MKKIIKTTIMSLAFLLFTIIATNVNAQEGSSSEKYSGTLNLGLGIGYYGYINNTLPVLHANYEFNAAKNFTLAPFITFYSYSNRYYWGNKNNNYPFKYYRYRETVIPIGVKGTYYFDELLNANSKWDFYLGASLGYSIRTVTWDSDYYGDKYAYHNSSGLYLDGHIGTEYHFNQHLGMFLDLSSGVSTIGLAIH